MLRQISTEAFIEGIILLAAIYYTAVAAIYYSKDIGNWLRRKKGKLS